MKAIIIAKEDLLIRTNSNNSYFVKANDEILELFNMYYKSPVIDLNKENGIDNELDKFIKTYGNKFSHFHPTTCEIIPANQ